MSTSRNPGRLAGLWYLLLILLGPLRLIYIPGKLFLQNNPAGTVANLLQHEWLFRLGMLADLAAALTLVILSTAFLRLFETVDRHLALLVVLLGGVMPALLYFVNVANDATVLTIAKGAPFLSALGKPQQDALAMTLLRLHDNQNDAAETLWGAWLFPLAVLVYRSRFLPRFLGVWLALNGLAYMTLSVTGLLLPQVQGKLFRIFQPALFAEMALMLWLVIKGATPTPAAPPDPSSVTL